MQRVRTESGSVYDVDDIGMRIRRVHGQHGPSDTRPQDGIWRRMSGIEGPVVGEPMVVYWAKEAPAGRDTDYGFRTTTVVEVVGLDDKTVQDAGTKGAEVAKNVLGSDLEECSVDPVTGFYRDGCCNTGAEDVGVHTVCVVMTAEFLTFSKSVGNDLSTPQWGFPGLQPGDRWCLCAPRWQEALEAGSAPEVVLEATHAASLEWVRLDDLVRHAVGSSQA